jgi:hypothetical protein
VRLKEAFMQVIDCDVGKQETISWSPPRIFLTAMLFDKISLRTDLCAAVISARKQWKKILSANPQRLFQF